MALEVLTAQLIGTLLEVFGYGIYVVICPQALLVIHRRRASTRLTLHLYATVVLTFILITTHLVIDVIRIFLAFTAHTSIANAPETFFADVGTNLNIAKNTTVVCTTLLADALLVRHYNLILARSFQNQCKIYRTLIVWSRKWQVLIIPLILYCVDIASSVYFIITVPKARSGQSVLASDTFIASKYFFAATLALNLVSSCLIAYKIWKIQSAVTGYVANMDRAQKALSIVLESASIYTIALVGMIILACLDNAALFFLLNSMPPIIGLVFTYVVLRSSDNGKRSSLGMRRSIVTQDHMGTNTDLTRLSTNEGVHVQLERVVYHDTLDMKPGLDGSTRYH